LRKFPGTNTAYPFGDSIHLTLKNDTLDEPVLSFLKAENIELTEAFESDACIEDRFLELMEKDATAQGQNGTKAI